MPGSISNLKEERTEEDMRAQESNSKELHTTMEDQQKESSFKALETDPSKLVIKNHIATGGFGSVYKGVYGGQKVAIKVLDLVDDDEGATLWNVFIREVLIWNNLDHPNIAKFIGATKGIADLSINKRGRGKSRIPRMACCMVAEYVRGGSLRAYLRRHRLRKLPFNAVVRLALDVARGLCYLHSQKIVHRDVKPENILLDKETKRVKIIDFGISTFEALNPSDQLTAQIGTAGYMAPEVASGGWGNHKCDVFSFGICLWEMYCCDKPDFSSNYRPVIPDSCPKDLAKLMERCWCADPERRPEMAEAVRILEAMGTSRTLERTQILDDQLMKGCFCF